MMIMIIPFFNSIYVISVWRMQYMDTTIYSLAD